MSWPGTVPELAVVKSCFLSTLHMSVPEKAGSGTLQVGGTKLITWSKRLITH